MKQKSDVEIMREAKLEAMGLPAQEDRKPRHDKPQMATDEMVRDASTYGGDMCRRVVVGHGTVQETDAKIAWRVAFQHERPLMGCSDQLPCFFAALSTSEHVA